MSSKLIVDAGVCRMKTEIIGEPDEEGNVKLTITSDCQYINNLADNLKVVNPYEMMQDNIVNNVVYKAAAEVVPHVACPVPCGIIKVLEVSGGLALKKPVTMNFE